jgi:hypothetical protein
MLTQEVLGKFDITLTEGMNMVSMPLITSNTDMNDVLGGQLIGSDSSMDDADVVWKYDPGQETYYQYAWLAQNTGDSYYDNKWFDPGTNPTAMSIDAGAGYYIQIKSGHGNETISIVGNIANTSESININVGINMIGMPFPVEMSIEDSDLQLYATGSDSSMDDSDVVWKYDPSQETYYQYAWLVQNSGDPYYDGHWFDPGTNPTTIVFKPGEAYLVQAKRQGFQWVIPKVY